MKTNSIFKITSLGSNVLLQAAGDNSSGSKKKEHIWHKKWVKSVGPYGEMYGYVECLFCRDPDHWGYVIGEVDSYGYGYVDWDGDGYADNNKPGDNPGYGDYGSYDAYGDYGGYEWYTYYTTVYYDIWVSPDEVTSGGSDGYSSENLNTVTNGEKTTINPSPLTERQYSKLLDDFDKSEDTLMMGAYLVGRTINIEYNEKLGCPGKYFPDTDTICLGPGADDTTIMRELLHAIDVSQQPNPHNTEMTELIFGGARRYPSDEKYYLALLAFKGEMDNLLLHGYTAENIMGEFDLQIWKTLADLRKQSPEYAHMEFTKDNFNPKVYLDLQNDYLMKENGFIRVRREKTVPVTIKRKKFPTKPTE